MSDAELSAARAAAADLDRARARLDAGAVTLVMSYLPGVAARVTVDGRPLAPGETLACAGPAALDLPGIGQLTLAPGGDAAMAVRAAAEAEMALAEIFAAAGVSNLAGLVACAERRTAAEARAARAAAELAGVAPDGTGALEAEIARLRKATADADPDASDPVVAAAAEAEARQALDAAERGSAAAREARLAAAHAETAAREKQEVAGRARADAATAVAALPERAALATMHEERCQAADAAEQVAADLARAMPDVAAAEAAVDAAAAAFRTAEAERHRLANREAALAARIATRADEGVDERRDETEGRLAAAEARAAGYAAEVRALTRLRDALATARAEARERYLAPVSVELAPLLGLRRAGSPLSNVRARSSANPSFDAHMKSTSILSRYSFSESVIAVPPPKKASVRSRISGLNASRTRAILLCRGRLYTEVTSAVLARKEIDQCPFLRPDCGLVYMAPALLIDRKRPFAGNLLYARQVPAEHRELRVVFDSDLHGHLLRHT